MALIAQEDARTRSTATIVTIDRTTWGGQAALRLSLDRPLGAVTSLETLVHTSVPPRLDRMTAPGLRPDLVANLSAMSAGTTIRQSVFERQQVNAIRCYTTDMLVEGSRFDGAGGHLAANRPSRAGERPTAADRSEPRPGSHPELEPIRRHARRDVYLYVRRPGAPGLNWQQCLPDRLC